MPTTRQLAIPIPHDEIAEFCRKWGIKRLAFFGSVVRDDFGPKSDVDVLVEFREGETPGFAFIRAEQELAALVGRRVDLGTFDSLSHWIKDDVMSEAVEEYVEA